MLDLNYQALRFVLNNLIRNAVNYTDRGFVKVGYAARLSVADSGRGISPEKLPRIFERFFRVTRPPAAWGWAFPSSRAFAITTAGAST